MAYSRINEMWNVNRPQSTTPLPSPKYWRILHASVWPAACVLSTRGMNIMGQVHDCLGINALSGIIHFSLIFLCLCLCNSSCSKCMFCKIENSKRFASLSISLHTQLVHFSEAVFTCCVQHPPNSNDANKTMQKRKINSFWVAKLGGIRHMVGLDRIALHTFMRN